MARALIVGCGCRGRQLGRALLARGWQVRGTTRRAEGLGPIAGVGIEAVLADPVRIGTILEQVGDVTVVVHALGSAHDAPEQLDAIHGPSLERLLERLVDTPMRGFVYDATGPADGAARFAEGERVVRAASERWRIPVGILDREVGSCEWAAAAFAATTRLIAER